MEQRYGSLIIGAVLKRLRGSRTSCPMHLTTTYRLTKMDTCSLVNIDISMGYILMKKALDKFFEIG